MHRHKWDITDKHVIPPAITRLPTSLNTKSSEDSQIVFDALREKVVYVMKCNVCEKVKVIKK